jgi:hypothetical protein
MIRTPLLLAALLAGAPAFAQPAAALVLDDAERLARLLQAPALPDAEALRAGYLAPGTPGIRIFTPGRIEDERNLARAMAADPAAYRKGATLCLPAARALRADATAVMRRVAELLGRSDAAPVYVLFGAGNSGGTAGPDGLALGLEVLCAGIETPAQARELLTDFIAHELTHVYQARAIDPAAPDGLLTQALIEGFADYMVERARGTPSRESAERAAYGRAHEMRLWSAFAADIATGAGLGEWMYNARPRTPGQPRDMGYWIGQRICEAFVERAADKAQALQTLLRLSDPKAILRASGYAERFLRR